MTWNENSEFAALFNASSEVPKLRIKIGDKLRGKIIHISKDTVFLALDAKNEAMIALSELVNPEIGQIVEATVDSMDDQIWLTQKGRKTAGPSGSLVEGKVVGVNAGGVEVEISGQKAFCPIAQLDLNYIEDANQFMGKTLSFLITQSTGKQITLNRKVLLQKEKAEKTRELLSTLQVGDRVEVPVSKIADFGVFVDLGGGVEGLIPQSELGFGKVAIGDKLIAQILKIEPDPKRQGQMRISLSLKAALPDPFELYGAQLVTGAQVEGTVARLETYGAFVSLFPGLDGLIHISELSTKRIKHPEEVVKIGDRVTVRIMEADPVTKRVSLSLRDPEAVSEPQETQKPAPKASASKSLGTFGDLMNKSKAS
ncbi:MAG: S1 RNA-binding domain-containing protein [Myxococcaceae bacterium]